MTKLDELETAIEYQEAKLLAFSDVMKSAADLFLEVTNGARRIRRLANQIITEQPEVKDECR